MTSVFSHYEEASNHFVVPTVIQPELSTTGFIHMTLEEEPPMFSKLKVNVGKLPIKNVVTKLVVNNEIMLIAMASNSVLRINLRQDDKIEEIDLGKPSTSGMRLLGVFLDPHGNHCLVSVKYGDSQPELLYLPSRSSKFKPSSRSQRHEITAVGWNHNNDSDVTTGPILLGTSKGLLFESEFVADTDRIFQTSCEKFWRDVFDIGKGSHMPIQGIEFHRSSARSERYFVLVTTFNRLYQFVGNVNGSDDKPMLQHIFNSYLNSSIPEGFLEIPSSLKYSKLQFYYQSPKGPPKTFGWLTAEGIFHGNVDTTSPPGQDSVVADSKLLKYPIQGEGPSPTVPLNFVLTQFHAILLYPDRIVAVCLLNEEVVFQDIFSAEITGKLIGITKDVVRNSIWVYSERSVFKYKVTLEDRNMWRVYMEKGDFEKAKEYSKDNLIHKDKVLVRKAEMLFKKEKYQESAETYAETQSSFEEIALKFLQLWQIDALKTFLCRKLEKLKTQDKTQITMLVVWVIELFLNQLGQMRDSGRDKTTEYTELQLQFDDFMEQRVVKECVSNNCGTIYNLMASHGDKENLNKFTLKNRDFERVIAHHIQKNNHLEALDILKKQGRKDLFYQFSPALMQAVPKQMVQALIDQGRGLAPSRLIPALVMSDQGESDTQAGEAIRYLEFCVHKLGCQDQAIHNYLLALYARINPDKLMSYLASQGQDISMVNYDVHYALRLCRERHLAEACVQLSALLGLWESAVDLALLVSVELAKQTAAMPQNDPELRKKLWLKIAQHVVEEKDDIKQAMEFLQQCDLIKIEDILPFFSDFVTIDHFKDAICNSLQEYNQHIQDLKEEMEEATKSADVIREEIQSFRNRYAFVSSQHKCNLCSQQLLSRAFFVFPCTHRFHMDCLQSQVTPLLSVSQLNRLKDLQRQLASMTVKEDTVSLGSSVMTRREQVRSEVDAIVAGECLYCGENMIRSIDKPFIEEDNFDRIMKEWQ